MVQEFRSAAGSRRAILAGPCSVRAFEAPQSPDFAKDPDVVKFLSDLKQYGNYPDMPAFPHCMCS